jgi:tetratricopeptide (TPR) repeat protein
MRGLTPILAALLAVACATPATAKRVRDFDRDLFRQGYREILARWARGDEGGAARDLADLEASVVAAAESDGDLQEALRRAELGVARSLMSGGVEVLAPLAQLHESVYLEHLQRRQIGLALHSRLLVVELVETYARQGPGLLARSYASGALTSLAGHLQEARSTGAAIDLYERALALDDSNGTALLALAILWERHGDYRKAQVLLSRLLAREPDDREGALRLAINSLRLGSGDEGEKRLRALAGSEPSDWIRSLAFQELAKLLQARNDWNGAHKLLTQAVELLPADPTLTIQLAYVSDRFGVPYPQPQLVEALESAVRQPDLSPRFLYIRIPYELLDRLRHSLRTRSAPYAASLAQALGVERSTSAERGGG